MQNKTWEFKYFVKSDDNIFVLKDMQVRKLMDR